MPEKTSEKEKDNVVVYSHSKKLDMHDSQINEHGYRLEKLEDEKNQIEVKFYNWEQAGIDNQRENIYEHEKLRQRLAEIEKEIQEYKEMKMLSCDDSEEKDLKDAKEIMKTFFNEC